MATNRKSADNDKAAQTAQTETEGGQASNGRGWHGNPEGHAEAGRKGGQTVAQDREHMAKIGRRGGVAVSRDRQHMAQIGRKGGQARKEGENGAEANGDGGSSSGEASNGTNGSKAR